MTPHTENFFTNYVDHRIAQSILANTQLRAAATYLASNLPREEARYREWRLAMWGGIVGLIVQLISGAVGGNVAGIALKQYDLGTIGNSIAGIIGGSDRAGSTSERSSPRSRPAGSAEAS